MRIIGDLHIHSKYSRATSPACEIPGLAEWAQIKGIDLLATGDFTHPKWLKELKRDLKPSTKGIYEHQGTKFLLTAEVSTIFPQDGRSRKVHTVLFAPSFEVVEQINDELKKRGDLAEDGRPILMMHVAELLDIVEGISKDIMFIPAHAWTPWFGIFGSKTGFDSLEEAFGKKASHIRAIETGLSSDPAMNWMVGDLEGVSLISNSDAHSLPKLGREANVFELEELDYSSLTNAIISREGFEKTYEFYPDEGKYHWDGHRKCDVCINPVDTRKLGGKCPKCGKKLTVGVMHRVMDLSNKEHGYKPADAPPFTSLIPLATIISVVRGRGDQTKGVRDEYFKLVNYFGNEFAVLEAPAEQLKLATDKILAKAILNAREGKVYWRPGYDGVFGEFSFKEIDQPIYSVKGQKHITDF